MDRLTKGDLERIRRSLAMSSTVTTPVAQGMLDEIHLLRSDLLTALADVERAVEALEAVLQRQGRR